MEWWPILAGGVLGVAVGSTGVGGFLLVPVLLLSGSSPATAVVAALLANVVANVAMAGIVIRRRGVAWRALAGLVAGTVVGAALFAPLLGMLSDAVGRLLVALFLAAAGLMIVLGTAGAWAGPLRRAGSRAWTMVGIGALAQVASVLAGIGGPALTVPAMLALGVRQPLAIGTAIVHGVLVSGLAIVTLLAVRGPGLLDVGALLPAAALATVAIVARATLRAGASYRSLEVLVGIMALVGSVAALVPR